MFSHQNSSSFSQMKAHDRIFDGILWLLIFFIYLFKHEKYSTSIYQELQSSTTK